MNCPSCHNEIVLGRSTVWVRKDGKVAHVKCDPALTASVPAAATAPVVPAHDGPVGILRRTDKGWSVEVEGVVVFSAASGTAIGKWKKDNAPGMRLDRDPEVVRAETEQRASRDRRALDRLSTRKSRR